MYYSRRGFLKFSLIQPDDALKLKTLMDELHSNQRIRQDCQRRRLNMSFRLHLLSCCMPSVNRVIEGVFNAVDQGIR